MASGAHKWGPWHAGSGATGDGSSRRAAGESDQTYWTKGAEEHTGFLRRHPGLKIAASLLVLAVVVVVAFSAGSVMGYLTNTLGGLQSHDPATVAAARRHLTAARPGAPMTILFLGSDRRRPSGPGEVDSILLARLDPVLAPHDPAVHPPRPARAHPRARHAGHRRRLPLGGPVLALETIKALTGVPINHFVDVDFQGFIDIVNALGGVHSQVPPGLGIPPGPSWEAAPLQPGYHLLNGRQLLSYVRLEEDAYGGEGWLADQGAILAQLRSRLASKVDWSDPLAALRLLKPATRNTVSDIAGLRSWYDMAKLLVDSEHGHVSQVRLTGRTVKSGGVTTVIAGRAQVGQAVRAFLSS